MFPTQWRDVLEQFVVNNPAELAQMRRGAAKIDGVPMDDGADNEVEAGRTECLTIKGAVADFAALMEEYGALELMGSFALVETGLAALAQCRA